MKAWREAVLKRFWLAFNANRLTESRFFGQWYYSLAPIPSGKESRWWKRCKLCQIPRPYGQIMHGNCADCIIAESKRKAI